MAGETVGLTDAKIKGLKAPAAGQLEVADKSVPGLRVRVGKGGTKTFILRKRVGARVRNFTIGRYNEHRFGLADARRKARLLLSDIEAGGDPGGAPALKRAGAVEGTVRALFSEYQRVEADAKRSGKEIVRIFQRHILPEIGDRLADTITRADVTRLVDQVAAGGTRPTPVMGRAVAAQLSAFYGWALPRLPRLESNPCRDAGRPRKPAPRERVLSEEELRCLWQVLEDEPPAWRNGIRLLILTGQRRDEVFNADRGEFDLERCLWTIPGTRAKNGKAHLVPLSQKAIEIVSSTPLFDSPKLFPARARPANGPSGFSKMMARVQDKMAQRLGPLENFTLHDLRRTFATNTQRLGVRLEVTEAILNHIAGSRGGLVGVYQRHQYLREKGEALELWAADLERVLHQPRAQL